MTIKQTQNRFGIKGTKRLRKQWTKAIARGKTVFEDGFKRMPSFNPMLTRSTIEQRILKQINARFLRMGVS